MAMEDIALHATVLDYDQSGSYLCLAVTKIQSLYERNQANLKLKPTWPGGIFQVFGVRAFLMWRLLGFEQPSPFLTP